MERSRKLKLIDWTQANNSLNQYFEGNKSKLAARLKMSRTTITAFFNEKNVREAEFRKICLALRLNWEAVSTVELPGSPPPCSHSSNESSPSSQPPIEDEDIERIVAKVRLHCCTEILAKHREMQLFNLKKIPVDQLFVDVYVLEELASQRFATLRDFPEVWDEQNGVSWQTLDRVWMGGRKYRSSGIDIANQCPRLMILGKPGSGKTTFMKHLAVACCEGLFQPELIPVLIELRAVEVEKFNLLQLLQRVFDRDEDTTLQLLKNGRVLILLDGLDEVPNQWRERVQREINRFSDQQYANRMIITCRTQTAEYRIKDFEYVEAADFNAKQKQAFVRNWFAIAETNPSSWLARALKTIGLNSDDGGQKLLQQIESSPRLKELAGTPVLLSLICWVYTVEGKLPQTRSTLYSSGLRLLLQQWDENRAIKPESRIGQQRYQSLDLHDKQSLLSEVAYQKFKQPGNFVLFDETEIVSIIAKFLKCPLGEASGVVRAIEAHHGLLIERAQTLWSFSHLTFQEYFVAQWFVQSQNWRELAQQVMHPRWQEVFLILVEISQPANNVLWAIKREIDLSVATDQKVQSVLVWAEEKAASTALPYKPASIRAFYSRLTLDLAKVRDRALDSARARDIAHEIAHALDLDRPLALIRARALARALDLGQDLACDPNLDLALDFALVLTLALALTRIQDFARNRTLSFTSTQILGRDGDIAFAHTLTLAIALALTPQLDQRLQFLRGKLPNFSESNRLVIEQWWRNDGQDWTKRLRQLMMEHRNIGHDWQLTQLQEQTLHQHHDANDFLIKLLKQSGVIDKKIRQEIEDNLLLPISALQRLQPDLYSE